MSPLIEEFGLGHVKNADQSGFKYELHSGRTLEIKGEKKVDRVVQSKNSVTHSYTVIQTMSADGELIEPLYIVLQESAGKFGPQVEQTMLRPPNLKISCSRSGLMGKEHLQEWVKNVFVPSIQENDLLIIDSWSTFTEENIRKEIPEDKHVSRLYLTCHSMYIYNKI